MTRLIIAAALLLGGCASGYLPADPSQMTPEQLSAVARDKGASASCATFSGTLTTTRLVPVDVCVAFTVAPGIGAPDSSTTVPVIWATATVCA